MAEPDFRALCAELIGWGERTADHYYTLPEVLIRARAALEQPAPEPSKDYEALRDLIHMDPPLPPPGYTAAQGDAFRNGWACCCRVVANRLPVQDPALSHPAPKPPTDEELEELSYQWFSRQNPSYYQDGCVAFARAVLARYGQGNG